jgi:hypothetical protein
MKHTGVDTGQSLLSPLDVANGFFLEILSFEREAKPLRSSSFDTLCSTSTSVGGSQTQALTIVNNWPAQDAVCVLRLKVAKNF